ncbi:MAG: M15 family metallopeptidase [Deltaproteobacteria bacterium]|jgi:hypothetical protein|nr:M15 family metallopeptidase [Deltaproteobacteria bacterium]MBW2522066.1 M15 family metallopeptidase [Deltaproteobacteria bacterium]
MQRRHFIKSLAAGFILSSVAPLSLVEASEPFPQPLGVSSSSFDSHIKDYLYKMENFDQSHPEDLFVEKELQPVLRSCVARLKRLEILVGHGNFYLLGFDEGLSFASNYPEVGAFTGKEIDFLERIFYTDSSVYGFIGEKPIDSMTLNIKKNNTVKIPQSGNYLYRGPSHQIYTKLKKIVGEKMYLTSGIRGVVKQFLLFLDKVESSGGNLSLASRSLAPPGYSFHGIADFDVGQAGYGALNFTDRFTKTEVFKKLEDLDYISLRYTKGNFKGVRFEPWHIRVFS